jgi:hypothetical protein
MPERVAAAADAVEVARPVAHLVWRPAGLLVQHLAGRPAARPAALLVADSDDVVAAHLALRGRHPVERRPRHPQPQRLRRVRRRRQKTVST